ncbi:hypothetical protein [Bradyrhizobium sp. BR 1432]|uniref:hypothetical protein n=1 Tax=Bradyrhizobium sp. BR 1432 TaxID=3447966 RepID=UPI003EE48C23
MSEVNKGRKLEGTNRRQFLTSVPWPDGFAQAFCVSPVRLRSHNPIDVALPASITPVRLTAHRSTGRHAPDRRAAGRSCFCPNAAKRPCKEPSRQRDVSTGEMVQVLQVRGEVFDAEVLSVLGKIYDEAVAALPASMRTPVNRTEIAKLVLERTAAGEAELALLRRLMVAIAPVA